MLTIKPLELFEGGEGWQVVDEDDNVIFDNQTYYPTHPTREWAERIVNAVNKEEKDATNSNQSSS